MNADVDMQTKHSEQAKTMPILLFVLHVTLCSIYEKQFCKIFTIFVVCLQFTVIQLVSSLCCTWKAVQMFSNSLDECHILEQAIYLCNISNHNDVIVRINVQKCR